MLLRLLKKLGKGGRMSLRRSGWFQWRRVVGKAHSRYGTSWMRSYNHSVAETEVGGDRETSAGSRGQ